MTARQWGRAVKFANADLSDGVAAMKHLGRFRLIFGVVFEDDLAAVPLLSGTGEVAFGHPAHVSEARHVQSQIRILLQCVASGRQTGEARAILEKHRKCPKYGLEKMPHWPRGTQEEDSYKSGFTVTVRDGWAIYKARKGLRGLSERDSQVRTSHLIDPVCVMVRGWLGRKKRGAPPVRTCKLASCGRFFVRRGRRLFCSQGCKSKRWQMSRDEMRDYAFRRLARSLPLKTLRARMIAEAHKKSPIEKRRRHLRIFRAVLREKLLLTA